MTDRRGYSYPTADLDRAGQWPANTQQSSRYPAPSNAYQSVPANAYPSMASAAHGVAPVHPSMQYGVNEYAAGYPPSVPGQYMSTTPSAYHQPRQSYVPPGPPPSHQAPSATPHYTVPSQQYPTHQSNMHQSSPYYGRGDSQYQQPQYPASPSRPFSCDLCALSFNRQHDLKRHRETHSGEKPFLCNGGCGKTFTRKDALKRHQV
ncbi:hypothetical protein JVU11DRAFT_2420 [Chiua virens]|nr:hypothetical protein JVU11DRAFT_2420 [Chiua virens]